MAVCQCINLLAFGCLLAVFIVAVAGAMLGEESEECGDGETWR